MSLSRADAAVEDVDGDQLLVSRHPGDDAGDIGPARGAVVAHTVVRRRVEGLRDRHAAGIAGAVHEPNANRVKSRPVSSTATDTPAPLRLPAPTCGWRIRGRLCVSQASFSLSAVIERTSFEFRA